MTDAVPGTFLAALSSNERKALGELGLPRSFPRGAVLMFQNEPDARVMLLLAVRVKVTRVDHEGHEMLLSIRDPGDVLGELALIDGLPRVATVTALEPVEALVTSSEAFRLHLETTPRVAVVLLEVVTRRFRETTLKRSQSSASDTMGRLAARIVELAERYGEQSDEGVAVDPRLLAAQGSRGQDTDGGHALPRAPPRPQVLSAAQRPIKTPYRASGVPWRSPRVSHSPTEGEP